MFRDRKANSFLIAARSSNGVIGLQGSIPWHAPHDLKHFASVTAGAVLVMGRATFESLPGPLPGRVSVVIASKPIKSAHPHQWAKSFDEATDLALRAESAANTIAFIGGESVYRRALCVEWLSRAFITDVDIETPGDRFMPDLGQDWFANETFELSPELSPHCSVTEYRRNLALPSLKAHP